MKYQVINKRNNVICAELVNGYVGIRDSGWLFITDNINTAFRYSADVDKDFSFDAPFTVIEVFQ